MLSGLVPVFCITKVRELLLPKSVKSVTEGLASPSAILMALPVILISANGRAEVVKPDITPPGLTQLDVVPVNAKPKSVPLLVPVASTRLVTDVFVPPAIP